MFFPYRARIALFHLPVLTIFVCGLCFAVFTAQYSNQRALNQSAYQFCERENDAGFLRGLKWLGGTADPALCAQLMLRLYHAQDDKAVLANWAISFFSMHLPRRSRSCSVPYFTWRC